MLRAAAQKTVDLLATLFYFCYFLFKGKPEWKCDKQKPVPLDACCVAAIQSGEEHIHHHTPAHLSHAPASPAPFRPSTEQLHNLPSRPAPFVPAHRGQSWAEWARSGCSRVWEGVKGGVGWVWNGLRLPSCHSLWHATKKAAVFAWNGLVQVLMFLPHLIAALFIFLRNFFQSGLEERKMDLAFTAAPKPFEKKEDGEKTFNSVAFDPTETEVEPVKAVSPPPVPPKPKTPVPMQEEDDETTVIESLPEKSPLPSGGEFYSQRVFSPPPPPPPPPPPKPSRVGSEAPVSRAASRAISKTPDPGARAGSPRAENVKGAVPVFPVSMLDELADAGRRFQEKEQARSARNTPLLHPQDNMSQSYTQGAADSSQWRSVSAFEPESRERDMRAASQPPRNTTRPAVSRIGENGEDEAEFVFYGGEKRREVPRSATASAVPFEHFKMGRHVFTPVVEAEHYRDTINRPALPSQHTRSMYESRPTTPYNSVAAPFTSFNQQGYNGHASRTTTPYGTEDRRRAHTVAPSGRRSAVEETANRWPPVSNASGAELQNKDHWIMDVLGQDDGGCVTTKSTRVVERKTQDNYKWRDENGQLYDERSSGRWRGDMDRVIRDGPGQGRHWARTMEVAPNGATRFQDINRQYAKDFVVESVIRNY